MTNAHGAIIRVGMAKGRRAGGAKTPRIGLLTVGETSRILGVSPSTLRLWENVGLVSPVRSNGRYRLYSPDLLEVLNESNTCATSSCSTCRVSGRRLARPRPQGPATAAGPPISVGSSAAPERPQPRRRRGGHAGEDLGGIPERHRIVQGQPRRWRRCNGSPQPTARPSSTSMMSPSKRGRLVRPKERRVIRPNRACAWNCCRPERANSKAIFSASSPAQGAMAATRIRAKSCVYMMGGTLEIWLDELECHTLREGDSFWFESTGRSPMVQPVDRRSRAALDQHPADVLRTSDASYVCERKDLLHRNTRHRRGPLGPTSINGCSAGTSGNAATASTAFDDTVGEVSGTWTLGHAPASAPGLLIYVMVDSVAATLDAIVSSGGQIVQPIGADAPEITARFRDPGGNVIASISNPHHRRGPDRMKTGGISCVTSRA